MNPKKEFMLGPVHYSCYEQYVYIVSVLYTLFQNGCHFSILLFTCKLALLPRLRKNILLNFEFKTEATRANLQVNKRILKWRLFWNKVYECYTRWNWADYSLSWLLQRTVHRHIVTDHLQTDAWPSLTSLPSMSLSPISVKTSVKEPVRLQFLS